MTRSVRRQMVSDVPLGSFLSGGVDSSAIVAAMSRTGEQRVSTYTIGFDAEDLRHEIVPDDLEHARRVAALFGTDYHERILEPDVLDLLPKAVWHLEEPVADPAAISTYLICREAATRMTVMLSGMGGDEVFAGYPRYLAYRHLALARPRPAPVRGAARSLRLGRRAARPPGRLRGPRRNLWKFMRGAGLPPLERYLSFSSYYTTDRARGRLLTPELAAALDGYDPLAGHRALPRPRRGRRRAEPAALPRRQDVPAVPEPDLHGQDGAWRRRSRCACRCSTTSSWRSPRASRRT